MYLLKKDILKLISDKNLIIKPLLCEDTQINELSIDFRLGCDFLVSIQGRDSSINTSYNDRDSGHITNFFQETRRRLGDSFLLHPNQTVLTTTLEYVKLPKNIFAILSMRSSYSRLGLTISTIIQPGYCGCLSLELTNNNKNPINLTVGARLVQARLVQLTEDTNYFSNPRKYICSVRPEISALYNDKELESLHELWLLINNKS